MKKGLKKYIIEYAMNGGWFNSRMINENMKLKNERIRTKTPLGTISSRCLSLFKTGKLERKKVDNCYFYREIN